MKKNDMETMSDNTILCTEEQTKRAFNLGASIEESIDYHTNGHIITKGYMLNGEVTNKDLDGFGRANTLLIPTAEQMIGWLEKQGDIKVIEVGCSFKWNFRIFNKEHWEIMKHNKVYNSRPEATLAAIDAALDYLEKQKR